MAEEKVNELSDNELEDVVGGFQYKVQKGDTLWDLAKKYGTTVDAIVAKNKGLIKNPDYIQEGWTINI